MKNKSVTKQKMALSGTYKLILLLALLLSLTTIFVVLRLQNQLDQMALNEQIYFMQK
jgi:hypothetical protein